MGRDLKLDNPRKKKEGWSGDKALSGFRQMFDIYERLRS